jgi:hypothetical protein
MVFSTLKCENEQMMPLDIAFNDLESNEEKYSLAIASKNYDSVFDYSRD